MPYRFLATTKFSIRLIYSVNILHICKGHFIQSEKQFSRSFRLQSSTPINIFTQRLLGFSSSVSNAIDIHFVLIAVLVQLCCEYPRGSVQRSYAFIHSKIDEIYYIKLCSVHHSMSTHSIRHFLGLFNVRFLVILCQRCRLRLISHRFQNAVWPSYVQYS